MRSWLWKLAGACWMAAIISEFIPGVANASTVELGDVRFSFSQVVMLLAVGFAWGDMRQWRAASEKRFEAIEKRLDK